MPLIRHSELLIRSCIAGIGGAAMGLGFAVGGLGIWGFAIAAVAASPSVRWVLGEDLRPRQPTTPASGAPAPDAVDTPAIVEILGIRAAADSGAAVTQMPAADPHRVQPAFVIEAVQRAVLATPEVPVFADSASAMLWAIAALAVSDSGSVLVDNRLAVLESPTAPAIGGPGASRQGPAMVVLRHAGATDLRAMIAAAVRYRLEVIWVVLNESNAGYGIQPAGLDYHESVAAPEDFAARARMAGADGVRITSESDLDGALQTALAGKRPYVIDVQVGSLTPPPAAAWSPGETPGPPEARALDREDEATKTVSRATARVLRLVVGGDEPLDEAALIDGANLALLFHEAGRADQAMDLQERVVHAGERLIADHPDLLIMRENLAAFYRHAGRTREAVELQEGVYAASKRLFGEEHSYTTTARSRLAALYIQTGHRSDALHLHKQAIARRQHAPTAAPTDSSA
jgi:hypothetical protein